MQRPISRSATSASSTIRVSTSSAANRDLRPSPQKPNATAPAPATNNDRSRSHWHLGIRKALQNRKDQEHQQRTQAYIQQRFFAVLKHVPPDEWDWSVTSVRNTAWTLVLDKSLCGAMLSGRSSNFDTAMNAAVALSKGLDPATKRLATKNGGQWYLQGRQYWTDETDDEDAAFLRKAISTLHQAGRAVAGIKGAK